MQAVTPPIRGNRSSSTPSGFVEDISRGCKISAFCVDCASFDQLPAAASNAIEVDLAHRPPCHPNKVPIHALSYTQKLTPARLGEIWERVCGRRRPQCHQKDHTARRRRHPDPQVLRPGPLRPGIEDPRRRDQRSDEKSR